LQEKNMRTLRTSLALAVVTALSAVPVMAQGQDFSKVEIVTTKISDNFVALDGQGGRIGVLYGPDGVFMVDSQFAPLGDKIVAAIRKVSDKPIKFLVNTHVHGDHTGGNENIGKMGATIIARPMLRERLIKPNPPANGGAAPPSAPAAALPTYTPDTRSRMTMDGETIDLIPLPFAHTDGDTAVKFVKNDVLMTGDVFRSVGFPNIDRTSGGSLKGMLEAFDTLIAAAGPSTKVLPGHGPITNRAGLIAHKQMAIAIRNRVAKLMAEGKTQEQIVALKVTTPYEKQTGNAAGTGDRFIGQLFAELKAAS
jgi:glyoxylase-like metal-dependent hydrolase (beta-lactamase superfamily II)